MAITSVMGSFKAFRLIRNFIPNFSSCFDKFLMTVAKFLKSSSNFSIFSSNLTSNPLFVFSLQSRLHCRLRIHVPTTTPPTNIKMLQSITLFPLPQKKSFLDPAITLSTAKPTDKIADERKTIIRQREERIKIETIDDVFLHRTFGFLDSEVKEISAATEGTECVRSQGSELHNWEIGRAPLVHA